MLLLVWFIINAVKLSAMIPPVVVDVIAEGVLFVLLMLLLLV